MLFHKNHVFDTKKTCPTFACQNLGTFKEYRDIGLTSYRNLRISTCQNLGVFHKSHFFLTQNNPWPTFACQNLGLFEECKDIWAYVVSKFQD